MPYEQLKKKNIDPLYRDKAQKNEEKTETSEAGIPASMDEVYRQTAWAAGTDVFFRRDPSYHLSEEFSRTFDAVGMKYAGGPSVPENEYGHPWYSKDPTDAADFYAARPGENERFKRFSDISFKRGKMSAAIVRGTGKMMLFSCLKRTVGQEHSQILKERKLFQSSSDHRMLPNSRNSMNIVNRSFAESATGMVADSVKDARISLENLEKMAEGRNQVDGMSGTETFRKMYPFLFYDREQELLDSYHKKLKDPDLPENSEERSILEQAVEKVTAVIRRKEQTKREFLFRLRQLRDRAVEAEKLFSSEQLVQELSGQTEEQPEPQGPNDPDENNNMPDEARSEDENGQE